LSQFGQWNFEGNKFWRGLFYDFVSGQTTFCVAQLLQSSLLGDGLEKTT
jgi:hypothetical protein